MRMLMDPANTAELFMNKIEAKNGIIGTNLSFIEQVSGVSWVDAFFFTQNSPAYP